MKRVSVLFAAVFCTASLAQEAGAPVDGAAYAPWDLGTRAAEPEKAEALRPAPVPAVAAPVLPVPVQAAPAPAGPLTRADSALNVYKSARDNIIATNRKFPRPPGFRSGQAADSARAPRAPDTALSSADGTIRAAWIAMGVYPPPTTPTTTTPTQQQRQQQQPAEAPAVTQTAALPRAPETRAQKSFKAQTALGLLVPINFGGEPNFRPWWNMGYHASYKEIDADAQFSRGLGVDLSLYTFSQKKYKDYYESMEGAARKENLSISGAAPMLIVDVGYYLKLYPANSLRIPYISGSAAICGAFFGGAKASYNDYYKNSIDNIQENLIEDVYILNAALGVGADYPVYAGIRAFAEVHYSLRLGLYSMFNNDGQYLGGFVPQIPIKFGVMVPFKSIAELLNNK